jgi:hypothetical protein
MKSAALGGLMLGVASAASAEEFFIGGATLGLVRGVELSVVDQVSDRCWTNPSLVKQKIRLILEQSEIPAHEPDLVNNVYFPVFEFGVVGLRAGACVGSYMVKVSYFGFAEQRPYPGSTNTYQVTMFMELFQKTGVVSSDTTLNQLIEDFAEEATSEFAAAVISGRRDPIVQQLLSEGQEIRPITQQELQPLLEPARAGNQ